MYAVSVRNALLAVLLLSSLPATVQADFDTDLVSFNGRLYATFIAGGGDDYAVYVMVSKDGSSWETIQKFDNKAAAQSIVNIAPRFTIGPDGRLLLSCAAFPKGLSVWATKDGKQWDLVKELVRPTCKLQNGSQVVNYSPDTRIVWNNKTAFYCRTGGICGEGGTVQIYSSQDGAEFGRHMDWMSPGGNDDYYDTTLLKTESLLLCLTNTKYAAKLGLSKAPFKDWEWNDVVPAIRKPNLLRLPDRRLIVSAATYQGGMRHALFELDVATGKLKELRTIPTNVVQPARTGLTLHNGQLWVGYRVKAGNGYSVRATRVDPIAAESKPPVAKGSIAALVRGLLAEKAPERPDSLRPEAGVQWSGRFPYEVVRRQNAIAETLTLFEFADTQRSTRFKQGMMALGPKTRKLVAPLLCSALTSGDRAKRQRAVDALSYLAEIPQSVAADLVKAAEHPDPQVRKSALRVLSWVRPLPKSAEPMLRARLRESALGPRVEAAACLLSLNENDEETIRVLVDLLRSRHFEALRPLKRAGTGLLRHASVWKTTPHLQNDLKPLLQGREAEAWPILIDWFADKNTPREVRWRIPYTTGYVKKGIPAARMRKVAIGVVHEDDSLMQRWALLALAEVGNFDGAELSDLTLRTLDKGVRFALVKALGTANVNPENAIQLLRKFRDDPDDNIRRSAFRSLAKLGDADDRMVQMVTSGLRGPENPVPSLAAVATTEAAAAEIAINVAPESPELLPALMGLMADDCYAKKWPNTRDYLCNRAVPPLVAMGQPAVPTLIEGLRSDDADVRAYSAEALGKLKAKEAIEPLVALLDDTQSELTYDARIKTLQQLRLFALSALANFGPDVKHLLPKFAELLEHDWSRATAIRAIGSVGPAGKKMAPRLMRLDPKELDAASTFELAKALAHLSAEESTRFAGIRRVLRRVIESPDPSQEHSLARNTIRFAQTLGDAGAPLIPELKYLAEEHELLEFSIRAQAATALAEIDGGNPRWRSLRERWHREGQ